LPRIHGSAQQYFHFIKYSAVHFEDIGMKTMFDGKEILEETMQFTPSKLLVFLILFLLAGCSTVQPGAERGGTGFTEYGQASYYADKYHNRRTASGEIYKHGLKTAAHRKLPFGSRVKVTNVKNGKSVIVKINDRGPFVKGRVIDLSKSAFNSIGSISSGVINVKVEWIQ
jgi:rare lipoprotein A